MTSAFRDRVRELRRVRAGDLRPHPKNWRTHPDGQRSALAAVLAEVGWADALIAREKDGGLELVDGHLRADLDPEAMVPVLIVDLDDAEADKVLLTLDPLAAMATLDPGHLNSLVDSVGDLDGVLGQMVSALGRLQAFRLPEPNHPTDDPGPGEPPAEPTTMPGDVYLLGPHRLLCGDATDLATVSRLMNGQRARMAFTDPPYNVDYGASKNPAGWRDQQRRVSGDAQNPAEWESFCRSFALALKHSVDGDCYIWGASGPEGMKQRLWLMEVGAHWSATIIWKKDQLVLTPANYQRMYEPCFYGWFARSSYNGDRTQTEVWEIPRPKSSDLHPTMKPIELCARAITNSSLPGDIVLDLFGGSGSTLIACEQTERACFMAEIAPAYCDVIVRRWEAASGSTATRIPAIPAETPA